MAEQIEIGMPLNLSPQGRWMHGSGDRGEAGHRGPAGQDTSSIGQSRKCISSQGNRAELAHLFCGQIPGSWRGTEEAGSPQGQASVCGDIFRV
jgi:hypothetical protein